MKKFKRIMISILGGIDVTFYMFTPIILAVVWVRIVGMTDWTEYFFYGIGLLSTIFRAIKVGWLGLENGNRNTANTNTN